MVVYNDAQEPAKHLEGDQWWCGCANNDKQRHLDHGQEDENISREKRSLFDLFTPGRRSLQHLKDLRCPVVLVADYGFFSTMGGSSVEYAANYLVSVLQ